MRLMGLMPIYQQPRTSIPAKRHKLYPYLLRGVPIDRPNQVWCADITYIPLAKGFLYLVAIIEPGGAARFWHGVCQTPWTCRSASMPSMRRWPAMVDRRSSTPTGATKFHVVDMDAAVERGRSAHLNRSPRQIPRQHLHRASVAFVSKCECASICMPSRVDGRLVRGCVHWVIFYNHRRPHAAHDGETPVRAYRNRLSACGPGLRPDLHPTALAA